MLLSQNLSTKNTINSLGAIDYSSIILDLEKHSWSLQKEFISHQMCRYFLNYADQLKEQDELKVAEIGNKTQKQLDKSIRKSLIHWIDYSQDVVEVKKLNHFYHEISKVMSQAFFLSLKRHETQIAFYRKGDFYKKHKDQLQSTKHRQMTVILCLNNCEDGGELILYNRDDKSKIDCIVKPQQGTLIVFFSAHIYHEVKETNSKRVTLTTWLRDDEVPFLD